MGYSGGTTPYCYKIPKVTIQNLCLTKDTSDIESLTSCQILALYAPIGVDILKVNKVKEIFLKNIGQVCYVDDDDYELISKYSWYGEKIHNTTYAFRSIWIPGGKNRKVRMHRQIMKADKGAIVDHIDHNGLNNTRGNLRLCNNSQNAMNGIKRRGIYHSKYKGVTYLKTKNYWKAQLTLNGKRVLGKYFKTEIEAALAYDKAAREFFGEFAHTNFPI